MLTWSEHSSEMQQGVVGIPNNLEVNYNQREKALYDTGDSKGWKKRVQLATHHGYQLLTVTGI